MIPLVVGYKGFQSYGKMPYSSYKPGQISLIRDYYKDATTEKPDGNASLSNFKRFDSLAGYKMNDVKPQHYLGRGAADSATKGYEYGHEPELVAYCNNDRKITTAPVSTKFRDQQKAKELRETGMEKQELLPDGTARHTPLYKTTNHWISSYGGSILSSTAMGSSRSKRADWTYNKPAFTNQRLLPGTEYKANHGDWGEAPQMKLLPTAVKIKNQKNEINQGTTKLTRHIPGYSVIEEFQGIRDIYLLVPPMTEAKIDHFVYLLKMNSIRLS